MKTMLIPIILLLTCFNGFSQTPIAISPYPLAITHQKTTTLIFPYAIQSVDRGSADILAQKATGIENVLWVKAAGKQVPETNLTVITTDGKVYSYLVSYALSPTVLTLSYVASDSTAGKIQFSGNQPNVHQLKTASEKILHKRKPLHGKRISRFGISLQLLGTYIQDNVLYFRLHLKNHSAIDYDPDQLRFSIHDRKLAKRTASQQQELTPLNIYIGVASQESIKAHSEKTLVIAFAKFTLADQKYLSIDLSEKNGGRHLNLAVKNRILVKSAPVDP